MADKMRTTFPIAVSFAEGEAPTGTKLNAIGSQAKSGLAILERAIGDMWNQSGDPITSDYPLYITNLARHLGSQQSLNGRMPTPDMTGTTSIVVTQSVVEFHDKAEILLDFAPTAASDATLATSMTSLGFPTRVSTRALVDAPTEWAIDITNGRIYLGAPLSNATFTVDYGVSSFPGDSPNESAWNLIPSQSQDSWVGLKIVQISANKYWLVLPFRRPPTLEVGTTPDKRPSSSSNTALIASPSIKRYWGPSSAGYSYTAGVSDSRLYRYSLPQIVLDMFDSPIAGQVIPNGLIHLWNTDTDTIVEGLTFRIPESPITFVGSQVPWVIQVEGSTLDATFTGYTSAAASEAHAHYQGDFALICAGQSIATEISHLRDQLTGGSHSVGMQKRTAHSDLSDNNPAQQTRFPIATLPSFIEGDDHSQYLSRRGSTSTLSARRDVYNNGMLGDLLMSSTNSAGGYQNTLAASNRIWFGAVTSGLYLYGASGELLTNGGFVADGDGTFGGEGLFGGELTVGTDVTIGGDILTVDNITITGEINIPSRDVRLNLPLTPSWYGIGPGISFAIDPGNRLELEWTEAGGTEEKIDCIYFPIPYAPNLASITGVTLVGDFTVTDGSNTRLISTIATDLEVTGSNDTEVTNILDAAIGQSATLTTASQVVLTITFAAPVAYDNLGTYFLLLGLRHTGGAAYDGSFFVHRITLHCTQTIL
jgi:hypothetical protein